MEKTSRKMRSLSMSMPSGVIRMTLWEGTEDEEKFVVKSLLRGTPYVMAYGKRYELTEDEVRHAKQMIAAFKRS